MALTLDEYANYLDAHDAPWPAPPVVERPKAKPHLQRLPEVRAVTWSIYGTLLAIPGGELYFEHPQKFLMEVALEKTVQEFKMWGSMTRKPGQPSDYMGQLYAKALEELRLQPSPDEKYPEIGSEKIWENILKKLLQKEYKFDAGFYGSLNEFSRKVAYFFHASLQGTACYPGTASALAALKKANITQGFIADAQCFTLAQLQRALKHQYEKCSLNAVVDPLVRGLSFEQKARKPSERLFAHALDILEQRGITPPEVLHVGSRITHDVIPARRLGMRTALFAGDKASLQATPDQLKAADSRPDVLLTEPGQVALVVSDAGQV